MVSRLFYCYFAPREKNIPFYEERSKKAIFIMDIPFSVLTKLHERRLIWYARK